jgi:hypothetical protein
MLTQTLNFIQTFNLGSVSTEKINKYRRSIHDNPKKAEAELGRVLLLLNRSIEIVKSKIFAKLYSAYVDESITWDKFCEYSDITERLFVADLFLLHDLYTNTISATDANNCISADRIIPLGLVFSSLKAIIGESTTGPDSLLYIRLNPSGQKYCSIIYDGIITR